jgi:putative SOS response-associated peptidase YedK
LNARVETVMTKPFFREPFKKKRCLISVQVDRGEHLIDG